MSQGNAFVIGDIQGCYNGLQRVLEKACFDPKKDQLFAVGDLVARGEDSLKTLRYLKSLGSGFASVLGNHDLHLLAVANGIRKAKKSDKLAPLLNAPDLAELIDWLRQFPLARKIAPNTVMIHAGLYPLWSVQQSIDLSEEVSQILSSEHYASFLSTMYGNTPDKWSADLTGTDRHRFIVNACTRMRFLKPDARLEFESKAHPDAVSLSTNSTLIPWFDYTNKQLKEKDTVVFGHWAALSGQTNKSQFVGLDTGYVWGQSMTLLNLTTQQVISVNA
ncbi:symmetrical bis(5'-nucleosyl)-tetraphosphatase [Alteromonas sp. D210916BOD_24]|uniref:symmetrical bis(5'-nucleosyl)-tetraphosphatase n=1 Tax=Alteromonas sp. D210916BOD_24 TaxID=3157618 RepID=UPI00399D38DF